MSDADLMRFGAILILSATFGRLVGSFHDRLGPIGVLIAFLGFTAVTLYPVWRGFVTALLP